MFMTKKKYKLKPDAFLYLAVIIVSIILINKGINYYKEYKYHKTTEYKLIENGYSKEEIKLLKKYYKEKDLIKFSKERKDKVLLTFLKNKRFKFERLNEYLEYLDLNPSKTIDEIINEVNLNLNYSFYEKIIDADESLNNLIVINKYYKLKDGYEPNDLTIVSTKYSWGASGSQKLVKEAYDAYIKMHEDAQKEDIYLMISLSYRSHDEQNRIYEMYKNSHSDAYADKIAARPGHSDHETGLSFDVFSLQDTMQSEFKDTKTFEWLKNNAYKYGFIIRYPEGKEKITGFEYEPWHYRYVGIDAAKYITENNLTLEEYITYHYKK